MKKKSQETKTQKSKSQKRRDRRERLLLHQLVRSGAAATLAKVMHLVQKNPACVKERDATGHLALHYACSRGAPLSVVKFLAEQYPEGLAVANDYKALPVHYACDRAAPLDVVKFVVDAYPKGLEQKGFFGNLPVHCIVACPGASQEAIEYVVDAYPNGLMTENIDGWLPLHQCWMKTVSHRHDIFTQRVVMPLECLMYLAEENPDALFYKMPPALNGGSYNLLENQIWFERRWRFPKGAQILSSLLKLFFPPSDPCKYIERLPRDPLRFIIKKKVIWDYSATAELFMDVYKSIPSVAHQKMEETMEPLMHYALEMRASLQIIDHLTVERPHEVHLADKGGRYPLDFAIRQLQTKCREPQINRIKESKKIFQQILELSGPEALRKGLTTALSRRAPLSVVQTLLQHKPEAFEGDHFVCWDEGEKIMPVHWAACCYKKQDKPDVLFYLLLRDPSALCPQC
ncbi:Ankyrin Repeat [Seminavis robusta]|uniref:Ankyrin Repeat n=1 Tax=Seminavis robusta TaxID=568900 RepID=A0A9N8H6Z5_9STRA|nr:Ankyrin Repeat [Seminavis robusta]|eukprot:Sro126_g060550.1 Ankyrin Repeat (459) ;mRNA; f:49893-51269